LERDEEGGLSDDVLALGGDVGEEVGGGGGGGGIAKKNHD